VADGDELVAALRDDGVETILYTRSLVLWPENFRDHLVYVRRAVRVQPATPDLHLYLHFHPALQESDKWDSNPVRTVTVRHLSHKVAPL
jgi:hypothetical protein